MFHLPATSASVIGAGAGVVVVDGVVDAASEDESAAAFSFFVQAAAMSAQQTSAERVMLWEIMEPRSEWTQPISRFFSRPNVRPSLQRCKQQRQDAM
jgi:hypothetical protein